MEERNDDRKVRRHPDTGRELTKEEQELISGYNSDPRNFKSNLSPTISRFPRPKELIAEPFDRKVTSPSELNRLLKTK